MTRERLIHLLDLVDEVNDRCYVNAIMSHSAYDDELHISLFYASTKGCNLYRFFSTYPYGYESYNSTINDADLVKGEAFLRLLLASAEHCEVMRRCK